MSEMTFQQAIQLATQLCQAGRLAEAESIYQQILAAQPQLAEIRSNLGSVQRAAGRLDEAIASFRQALAIRPDLPQTHSNLGDALCAIGDLDGAILACRQAISLRPNYASAWNNLGSALKAQGQNAQAADAFRQAISLQPDFPIARFNLAMQLLQAGEFEQGWPLYESRWQLYEHQPLRLTFDVPRWDGAPLAGRRLLVHVEQGFGDTLQFCRYIPILSQQGRVILMCQPPLARLMQNLTGVERVISQGDMIPAFDLHCPIGSLPGLLRTTLSTIPANVPYLTADPVLASQWSERLPAAGLKVGLVWAGRVLPDPARSIPPALLEPLAGISNLTLISLQTDAASSEPPPLKILDWTTELRDFADTAALMQNLDLIITIDTAAAHLAGAMGRPTWVLLPFAADWRWMAGRNDSPWYPTVKLFRQPAIGDWRSAIAEIVQALQSLKMNAS